MADIRWPKMTHEEVETLLGDGGTGVVSFSADEGEPPYSIPVSYGYVADAGNFHFRFALSDHSEKDDFLGRPVSFVTYDRTDDGWRSVVARGELEDLSDAPYESTALQERWGVDIPLVDIFQDPPEDVTFQLFRLVPDRLTGRKSMGNED
jgi:hypothetical protein